MRSVLLATAALAATFAAATAAQALPTQLVSNAVASVTGGCNGCGVRTDQTTFTQPILTSNAHDASGGASFADASVTTTYGTQRVSASAFLSAVDPGPDAQTNAFSEYDENFAPGAFNGQPYNLQFLITGSFSVQPVFGPGSTATLIWDFEDVTTGAALSFGTVVPGGGFTPVSMVIPVPITDATSLRVMFSASAFADHSNTNGTVFADFSHTVHTYIDAVNGGPDIIGESGHDYATPIASGGAPEPAVWALMLAGFGSLGAALRRRRAVATA